MAHTHAAEKHVMAVVTSRNNRRSAGSDFAMRSLYRRRVFSVGFTLRHITRPTELSYLVEWSVLVGE
jgi:hypothetical protein